jgi:hypothetical protein
MFLFDGGYSFTGGVEWGRFKLQRFRLEDTTAEIAIQFLVLQSFCRRASNVSNQNLTFTSARKVIHGHKSQELKRWFAHRHHPDPTANYIEKSPDVGN